jgi:hypothetical protein
MAKKKKKRKQNHTGRGRRKSINAKTSLPGREEPAVFTIGALNKRLAEINALRQKKMEVDRIKARARERKGAENERSVIE